MILFPQMLSVYRILFPLKIVNGSMYERGENDTIVSFLQCRNTSVLFHSQTLAFCMEFFYFSFCTTSSAFLSALRALSWEAPLSPLKQLFSSWDRGLHHHVLFSFGAVMKSFFFNLSMLCFSHSRWKFSGVRHVSILVYCCILSTQQKIAYESTFYQ